MKPETEKFLREAENHEDGGFQYRRLITSVCPWPLVETM